MKHGRVAALDVGESARLAPPVWQDFLEFCDTYGVKLTSLPLDPDEVALEAARAELADASRIAVLACPDPYTRIARDIVAAVLGPGSVAGLDLLLDKSRTRELCAVAAVPVPPGLSGVGRRVTAEALGLLRRSGRVVVKDPTGYAGIGVRAIDDPDELRRVLDTDRRTVVEAYLRGEEFSVEAVRDERGVHLVGWMAKGCTDGLLHPLDRVRYVPAEPVPPLLRGPCERLLAASGHQGIAEVELVVVDGRAYVLECNPRTSGVTPALHLSGRSSLRRYLAGLLGVVVPAETATAAAEYGLGDPQTEPGPTGPGGYTYQPPPGTEFDARGYLCGDVADLRGRLTATDPRRGADFADRVRAATEVLAAGDPDGDGV